MASFPQASPPTPCAHLYRRAVTHETKFMIQRIHRAFSLTVYLFIYLLIYNLFSNVVTTLNHTVASHGTIREET
jgi:hypothetical protein